MKEFKTKKKRWYGRRTIAFMLAMVMLSISTCGNFNGLVIQTSAAKKDAETVKTITETKKDTETVKTTAAKKDTKNVKTTTAETTERYPYLLQVNRTTNVVTVFTKDKKGRYTVPYKALVCSTGHDTPTGTFRTPNKFRWQPLMHNVWGQYCTQITGNILFHSVYYDTKNPANINISAYNKLGTTASAGCVRLKCGDAKWVYDNCALGTTVKIINGSSKNDPLGKPKTMKISTGWDPTDPNKRNPWHNKIFKLTFEGDKHIEYATKSVPLKSYITLTDVCGTKCSKNKYLRVTGKVNTKKLGSYKVTYSATDKLGKTYTKTVTFKVVDTKKPILFGVDDIVVERNDTFQPMKGVSAKTVSGSKLSVKRIKVTGKVDTAKNGVYTIKYKATRKNKKSITKTRKITVQDTKAPKISGVADTTLKYQDSAMTVENKIALIQKDIMKKIVIKDNGEKIVDVTPYVTITVQDQENDHFTVICSVRDDSNNSTTKKLKYTLKCTTPATTQTSETTETPAVVQALETTQAAAQ